MTSNQVTAMLLDPARQWIVQVTLAARHEVSEQVLVHMDDQAEQRHDATVTARAGGPGLVFTAEVSGEEIGDVPAWAVSVAEGLVDDTQLIDLRVSTPERYEADALRPDTDELAGASEAAELLGVSRQRLAVLRQRHDFPAPMVELAQGPVWGVMTLRAYDERRQHEPGRPRLDDVHVL